MSPKPPVTESWVTVRALSFSLSLILFLKLLAIIEMEGSFRCKFFIFYCVVMGKVEGQGECWHGHVTAVTVAPEYRRQQLAKKLMNLLEDISDKM